MTDKVTVSISLHGKSIAPMTVQSVDDPISTFQDDVVDLRQSASLFTIRHFSNLLSRDCVIEFPGSVRIFSEGDYTDTDSFKDKINCHAIISATALPEKELIFNISLDLQINSIDSELIDSLTLLQKVWYPRELASAPVINIIESDGSKTLSQFIENLISDVTEFEFIEHAETAPKVAIFIQSKALSDNLERLKNIENAADVSQDIFSFSGLTQNVLDYKEQDISEIRDSLTPAFNDDEIKIFSNPNQLIEVTAASRSFAEGLRFIGTCPYFYLLHIFLFHNEVVLQRWAKNVAKAYEEVNSIRAEIQKLNGSKLTREMRKEIRSLISSFVEIRLNVMTNIRSNSFPNTFRYETERRAFQNCSESRNLENNKKYWTEVLENCEQSVNDLARLDDESRSSRLSYLIGALTVVTVLSSIIDLKQEISIYTPDLAFPISLITILLIAAAATWLLKRSH